MPADVPRDLFVLEDLLSGKFEGPMSYEEAQEQVTAFSRIRRYDEVLRETGRMATTDVEDSTLNIFTHVGLIVKAEDTGRILLTQRAQVEEDDDGAHGKWEWPGGSVAEGEDPFQAAQREFEEETGIALPEGTIEGAFIAPELEDSGVRYLAIVYLVPDESIVTEYNPDFDEVWGVGFFEPLEVEETSELLRSECYDAEWHKIRAASFRRNQKVAGVGNESTTLGFAEGLRGYVFILKVGGKYLVTGVKFELGVQKEPFAMQVDSYPVAISLYQQALAEIKSPGVGFLLPEVA